MNDDKACSRCGVRKPRAGFWRKTSAVDGLQNECIECLSERNAARRKNKPEQPRLVDAKYRYGVTALDLVLLLRVQDDRCGACRGPFRPFGINRTGFVIDHDHQTGYVRGLLCQGCNTSLEDGNEPLRFAEYLAMPPARRAGVFARKVER